MILSNLLENVKTITWYFSLSTSYFHITLSSYQLRIDLALLLENALLGLRPLGPLYPEFPSSASLQKIIGTGTNRNRVGTGTGTNQNRQELHEPEPREPVL